MKKLWTLFLVLVFTACLISPAITTDVYAADGVVMTVNGTDYTNHNEGWSQAINIANGGTKTTVVLKADWNAVDGDFTCAKGTENGYLYLNDIDIDLTIDLNGYAINRGLTTPKSMATYSS
jgi:uncharacterized membrane protein